MANLFNKYIYQTYKSIVGIGQSGTSGLTNSKEALTDGEGKELPIKVSETEVELTGETNTTKNLSITAYGPVINDQGQWIGPSSGLVGSSGTSGTSGATGSSGVAGSSGTSGTSATSGTSGKTGSSGASGSSGTSGTSGSSGTSGKTGSSGVAGSSGTSGTSGINGSSGATGSSGTSGTDGSSGTSGTDGSSGTSGTDGSSGTSGTSGMSGSSGTSGLSGAAINDTTPSTGVTGTLVESIADTLFIPANTVKDGDVFLLTSRFNGIKSVSATTTYKVYINSSNTIGGTTTTLTGIVIPTTATVNTIFKYFYINKADGTGAGTAFINSSTANELGAISAPTQYINAAIDWTQNQYIVITATLGNTSNSAWVAGSAFTNTAGGKGLDGPQGPQGPANGSSGTDGSSGTSGTSGLTGTSGTSGINGASGLVNGTGTNSLKNDDALTTVDAIATDNNTLALGAGAAARAANSICIGQNAVVDDSARVNTVVIGSIDGPNTTKAAQFSTAVGSGAQAIGANSLAVGYNVLCAGNNASAIGDGARAFANNSVAIGDVDANTVNTLSTILIQSALTVDKNFANDVDATAGGIPLGGFYHHNGVLRIRHT